MATLHLVKFTFKKADLAKLPPGLAALVAQCSVLSDEIGLFLRASILCKANSADRVKRDADIPLVMEAVRQLAAVLSKAWEAYQDPEHLDARKYNEARWDPSAGVSLAAIKKYFGDKDNNVDRIRNTLTHHHRLHVLRDSFRVIPGEEPLILYSGSLLGNFRSSAAYLIVGHAMLKGITPEEKGIPWDDLWKEVLGLARHFQNVQLGHVAAFLNDVEGVAVREDIELANVHRIGELLLTHFVAEQVPANPGGGAPPSAAPAASKGSAIRMTRVSFSKCQLEGGRELIAVYSIQAAALVQLLILWWKLTLMCGNCRLNAPEAEAANVALHGYLVRRVAGELHEAWVALQNQNYDNLPVWDEQLLPTNAADALRNLRKYFSGPGGKYLKTIRDKNSHHSDFSRILADLNGLAPDSELEVILCEGQVIARFDAADLAGEKVVFVPGRRGPIPGLEDQPQLEIAQVATWMRILLVEQLNLLVPVGATAEELEILDVPRLEDLEFPYWVAP